MNLRSNSVIANDSQLTLVDLMASDGGPYQCSVKNSAGEDSITVTLNGNIGELYNLAKFMNNAKFMLCSFSNCN